MELAFLSQVGGILGPFAWIMGTILNGIYELLSLIGIENIAICIFLFTFVVKMLMLPITIKQQKGTRLTAKMNPEIQKVQAKYKGKKDQESMRKQQAEMQEIYAKYGTSPMAGCLPMLISLPIIFALYRVVYAIPAYVNDINQLYSYVASQFSSVDGYADALKQFLTTNEVATSIGNLVSYAADASKSTEAQTLLIDIFSKFKTADWNNFLDINSWNTTYNGTEMIQYFANADSLTAMQNILSQAKMTETVDSIMHANRFIGSLNILDNPGWGFPGILIPLAAGGSQFLQTKLMSGNGPQPSSDDPTAASMKTMNTVFPVVSIIFCTFMPIGVGIYWIASSLVQIGQQFFINSYFNKIDIDELVAKNVAKSNKRKEKLGVATGNKMAGVAKTQTKSIETKSTQPSAVKTSNKTKPEASNYKKSDVSYSAGSISANANILKRNSDKGDNK